MYRYFFSITLLLSIFLVSSCKSQNTKRTKSSIILTDAYQGNGYTNYWTTDISDLWNIKATSKYPPSNLFDANFKTCWVTNHRNNRKCDTLYLLLKNNKNLEFNIFSGYGKSKSLYFANSRPKKLQLTYFAAIVPNYGEYQASTKYETLALKKKYYINLADTFGLQTFNLKIPYQNLSILQNKLIKNFNAGKNFDKPKDFNRKLRIIDTSIIVQVVISDTYKGSKSTDVCISEIFLNNTFVSGNPKTPEITKVYTNKAENTLLIDTKNKKGIIVLSNNNKFVNKLMMEDEYIYQILDISKNKKWAIISVLPAHPGPGRVEEINILVDLSKKKILKHEMFGLYDFYSDNGDTYVETDKGKILLR